MEEKIQKRTLKIAGMTCTGCESKIERKLGKTAGIIAVQVRYNTGTAVVTFDSNVIGIAQIEKMIERLDYKVVKATQKPPEKNDASQAIGIGILILAVWMMLNRMGALNMFNVFPEAKEGMGYGMLFVIGLLTSIHCVAMCGGINLSQCVPQGASNRNNSKFENLRPSFLYNAGRVVSYTIVGGLVGALGSVVSFSGAAKGAVQLAAGVFMVIMGLNMLNIFPALRKFTPRMPKIFAKGIYQEKERSNSAFYVGLLNGLMPCGPLQAMQLYALSTGSPIQGALSMLLFSLGTVPLMFGLGALSSLLSKKFTARMMTASAALVIVLGVAMFHNGLALAGIGVPVMGNIQNARKAEDVDGVQRITTQLLPNQYEPIVVKVGVPVKWTIQAADGTVNGCNNKLIIPEYGNLEKQLAVGDNVIEFTPTETGTFPYSCWMGMIQSSITVVAEDGTAGTGDTTTSRGGNAQDQTAKQALINGAVGGNGVNIGSCCGDSSTATAFANGNIPTEEIQIATEINGVQHAKVIVDEKGYAPAVIVVEKGKPFIIEFDPKNLNGCNSYVKFPAYGGGLQLPQETATPELTANQDFIFECGMSMLHGYVKVVDDIQQVDLEAVKQAVESYTPPVGGGGCCG